MRGANIAENIARGRKDLGITQAELAERVGVTKAAVSKWELGQSLPDVGMLPRLASQLGITLDELFGYGQALSDEEVSAIVREASDLSAGDRGGAIARCELELREHGSSWNLLVAVAGLYVGWAAACESSGEAGEASMIRSRADELCRRVVERCRDVGVVSRARQVQATLLLADGRAAEAAELLEGMLPPRGEQGVYMLLLSAYQQLGRMQDALELSRRHLAESASAIYSEVGNQINMSEDTDEIARLACLGEQSHVALAWTLEGTGPLPSLRIMAASRLLALGEEGAALGQLEALLDGACERGAGGADDLSLGLARAILENEPCWHDDALVDRRKEMLGRL